MQNDKYQELVDFINKQLNQAEIIYHTYLKEELMLNALESEGAIRVLKTIVNFINGEQ